MGNEHETSIQERIEALSISPETEIKSSSSQKAKKSSLNGEKKKNSTAKKKSSSSETRKGKKKKPAFSREEPNVANSSIPSIDSETTQTTVRLSSSWIGSSKEMEDTEILAPFESPSTTARKSASKSAVGKETKEDRKKKASGQVSPLTADTAVERLSMSMSDIRPPRPSSRPAKTGKPKKNLSELFKKKVHRMITINRLFGHKNYDKLAKAEKDADKASYKRSKGALRRASRIQAGEKKTLLFSDNLIIVYEIEDLTRKNTSWGDVWDDLYMDEDTLANMKYEAFEEELRRTEEGYVSDDLVMPYSSLDDEEENGDAEEKEEEEQKVEEAKPKKRNLKNLFKAKVHRIVLFNRMFAGNTVNQLDKKERDADRKSFRRSSKAFLDSIPKDFKIGVSFASVLVTVYEIEDLTKRNTSWGDVWDDLYFDEETLADFKYNAFLEEVARESGEYVSDDE